MTNGKKISFMMLTYLQTIETISEWISKYKNEHQRNIVLVAIEGLSCTGKSTLAKDVKTSLKKMGKSVHVIEGDLFHRGLDKTIPAYKWLIKKKTKRNSRPIDLFPVLWDMKKLENYLIRPLIAFNESSKSVETLLFPNVLKGKRSGTAHDERLRIDRRFIILLPAVFVRHLPGIDLSIELRTNYRRVLERKISRASLKNAKINENFIKDTFIKLEVPWFLSISSTCPRKPDIIIDTTNPTHYKITQTRPFLRS